MPSGRGDRLILVAAIGLLALGVLGWIAAVPRGSADGRAPMFAMWCATFAIAAGLWAMGRWKRPQDQRLVAVTMLAVVAPFAMSVLLRSLPSLSCGPDRYRVGSSLAALAVLPLCLTLAARVPRSDLAAAVRGVAIAIVLAAVVVGFVLWDAILRGVLVAAAVGIAALVASIARLRERQLGTSAQDRLLEALGLGLAGVLAIVSGLAMVTATWHVWVGPAFAASLTGLVLTLIAIRPLAEHAGSALSQRDLVVAASEQERHRLAAALHDGPLADLTLLIQRLDVAGDQDGSALARSIAGDLRQIGNDLNLPVLTDLGAAPALEWLVQRCNRHAGSDVRLELDQSGRPPAPVELAVYRVAQEALANAVRHGQPPIQVRYTASPAHASLSVDDAGPGLERGALEQAVRAGHLGMVLMAQRAEAIGARLDLADLPEGGTRLRLTWQPVAR